MKRLDLINRNRETVGTITWSPPGRLTVNVPESAISAGIASLLKEADEKGLPLRTGGPVEQGGKTVYVERAETIRGNDERFLGALAEAISRVNFAGHRVFGVVRREESGHE